MRFDKIDAALEGLGKYKGKAYFFSKDAYVRYDWDLDREDFGYPLPITAWGLPSSFNTGLDAAVNGQGIYANKAYFFKGNKYARYDWGSEIVDLVDQPLAAWKLPESFLDGIDAVLNGERSFQGKTYFFKGDKYVGYDWKTDTVTEVRSIEAWRFPGMFGRGIDAAVNGAASFSGKAYMFKGSEYVRYDWDQDKPDPGYPHPIAHDWKHGVSIWANIDTATSVPFDARLREDDGSTKSKLAYPYGTSRGQAGWDVGILFGNLKSLATKLRYQPIALPNFICGNLFQDCPPLQRGQLSRLAINAHGESGEVAINGQRHPVKLTAVTLASDPDIQADLSAIRDALDPAATLLFMGCLAGKGLGGTALITALSLFMPGRKIVAFSTIGFSHGGRQVRHGEHGFTEPGMRDTEHFFPASSELEEDNRYGAIWNDLNLLPWASEYSPHAKVALNGAIIRGIDL